MLQTLMSLQVQIVSVEMDEDKEQKVSKCKVTELIFPVWSKEWKAKREEK